MKNALAAAALTIAALTACAPKNDQAATPAQTAAAPIAPVKTDAPAGTYKLDPSHASLVFQVNHLGFSHYTASFRAFDATLTLDPANPAASSVEATIDPRSLLLNAPPAGFHDQITGAQWLDAKQFPQMTFKSTKVDLTGPDTARVTGDLTLRGVTAPVVMDVKFNGGYPGFAMDPHARIGVSAHGVLKRSAYGIALGLPAPGSTMGVGDDVAFAIEAEFSGPAWKPPAEATEAPAQ
jgi:polyisoprenoid-binding protein YceI